MKNSCITFRLTNSLAERISVVAEAEILTVSDICRRSIIEALTPLEDKHGLTSKNIQASNLNEISDELLKSVD